MTNAETNTAAAVAAQGAPVAPPKASPKETPTRKKGAPKGQKAAKGGKPNTAGKAAKSPAKQPVLPRPESKSAKILALLRRPKGATLGELTKLTGWQNHSVRGFLSGTLGKKMRITVESVQREDGQRVYSISK